MASGQATSTPDRHVCKPPSGQPVGWLWPCPDCWSEFLYRPVYVRELGRVINLWVRRDSDRQRELFRSIACKYCGALPDENCHTQSGLVAYEHAARRQRWVTW
jgi:hypothetical protein